MKTVKVLAADPTFWLRVACFLTITSAGVMLKQRGQARAHEIELRSPAIPVIGSIR